MPAGMMIANPGDQDEAKDLLVDGPCAGTVGGGRVLRKNLPSLLSLGSERPAVGNKVASNCAAPETASSPFDVTA